MTHQITTHVESTLGENTRALSLKGSKLVFLTKGSGKSTLLSAAKIRARTEDLRKLARWDVALVYDKATKRLELSNSLTPLSEDLSDVIAVAISLDTAKELGPMKEVELRNDGIRVCKFGKHKIRPRKDPFRTIFSSCILDPWLEGKRKGSNVTVADLAASKLTEEKFERKSVDLLKKIVFIYDSMLVASPKTDAERQRFSAARIRLRENAENVAELQETSPKTEVSVAQHQVEIEKVSKSLDQIEQQLGRSPGVREEAPGRYIAAVQASDPVDRAIKVRERLENEVRFLDASTWAKWRGTKSTNPSAALGKHKLQNRVFAVKSGGKDRYPAFQFSSDAAPLPAMQGILENLTEAERGWPLLSWFQAENTLLGGRKPAEVLAEDPDAVVRAASRFFSRDD